MTPELFSQRQAFADTIYDLAGDNPDLFVVDVDLKSSLGLDKFAARFPKRFIECGVAENNAAAVAAGLAKAGKTVFLTSYACFSPGLNWNTIKQSICYNQLSVIIIGSHSGLMSADLGATHQMLEDVALMRTLPQMEVFAPADAIETGNIIQAVAQSHRPAYVRLVRPSTVNFTDPKQKFVIGKSQILQSGSKITLLGYGPILSSALALKKYSKILEVINCSSLKPLDSDPIIKSVKKTKRLIVLEDHQQNGGLGEAVATLLLKQGLSPKFIHLAVNDLFGRSAKDYNQLWQFYGLGSDSLIKSINQLL